MRYHLIPVRMAVINNEINKQVLVRMWRKGHPCELLVGFQIGAATVGNSGRGVQPVAQDGWLGPKNLLKTFFFAHQFSLMFVSLTCDPRQLFF